MSNEMKGYFSYQKKEYQKQHKILTEQISSLENNNEFISDEVQACLSLKGIKKIDGHVLVTLMDQIVIDENKNVSINLKFSDELQSYIS